VARNEVQKIALKRKLKPHGRQLRFFLIPAFSPRERKGVRRTDAGVSLATGFISKNHTTRTLISDEGNFRMSPPPLGARSMASRVAPPADL
jgi:hypothetical protein